MDNTLSLDRLSKCKALRKIQREFKIIYPPKNKFNDRNNVVIKYGFFRPGRPFALKSVKYIFKNQKDRIIKMINDEKIDMNRFSTGLGIKSYISLKPRYIEEDDADEFVIFEKDTKCIHFNEETLENLLERFSNAIIKDLGEDVLGIQSFGFNIVFSENIK